MAEKKKKSKRFMEGPYVLSTHGGGVGAAPPPKQPTCGACPYVICIRLNLYLPDTRGWLLLCLRSYLQAKTNAGRSPISSIKLYRISFTHGEQGNNFLNLQNKSSLAVAAPGGPGGAQLTQRAQMGQRPGPRFSSALFDLMVGYSWMVGSACLASGELQRYLIVPSFNSQCIKKSSFF